MKHAKFLLLALALPMGMEAQAPAGPPKDPITAAFRARTTALRRNLVQAFDSIPESKFSYKPTPAQQTIGYIAQHLASDNYLFCNNFGEMKASVPESDVSTPDTVRAKWPRDTLLAKLKASVAFCDQAMGQLEDSKLSEMITMSAGGQSRSLPRANMVLGHALDLGDHYSQIANYMRLNGMLPPSALPRPRPQ